MALSSGFRIGVYEVVSALGAGGMGEVYRARDTRLQREVALKVLPDAFSSDPDRLARFEREAQLLAALNHPHIAAIHGLEESSGVRALVLELVEGDTLADRIALGAIPVPEALSIARQIADALDAAHEQGIIHRDLKPANVKITPAGTVKVLDFGLAKLAQASDAAQASSPNLTMSPTLASPFGATQGAPAVTSIGVILGTAAYMSPEQAKGRQADKRSDVWAFGCVLFEMLTGQRPFEGGDLSDLLASVLKSEPAWTALPASTPPAVRAVIERCMRKDPKQRLRDMGDVRLVLDGAFDAGPSSAAIRNITSAPSRMRRALPWGAGIAIGGGLAALAAWGITRAAVPPPSSATRFVLTLPESDRLTTARGTLVALSPDGRTLAYRAQRDGVFRLYLRPLDRFDGTAIGDAEPDEMVVFSPDSQWLAYVAGTTLKKIPAAGGPSQVLAQLANIPRGASWGPDNTIVLGMSAGGVASVPASGGVLTTIVKATDGRGFWYPQVLPGGRAILYTVSEARPDGGELQVFLPKTGERRTLLAGSAGRFLNSGHLVFIRGGSVWAVAFDPERLEVRGTPVPVAEGVRVEPGGAVQFTAADAGAIAYVPSRSEGSLRLAWVDRDGKEERLETPERLYNTPRLSPDGTRVAVFSRDQDADIWIWSFERKTLTRLTFDAGVDYEPTWMPDGSRLVFVSARDKVAAPFWQPADGTGKAERITTYPYALDEPSVSPDGKWIAMRARVPETGNDIVVVDLTQNGRVQPLVHTKFVERNPTISMDGRWIAYESDESGLTEVYVRPFPDVEKGRWQVSQRGGSRPLWARNGRELFFQTRENRVMIVPFNASSAFEFGNAALAADLSGYPVATARNYDVSADGRRFLVITTEERAARPEINVVVNWVEELRKKVPIN